MAWDDLPNDVKINTLIDVLIETAVSVVAPNSASRYADVKASTTDRIELMLCDVDFWFPLVHELRQAGKIPSAEETRNRAISMLDMRDAQMRKALFDFVSEVRQRFENQ